MLEEFRMPSLLGPSRTLGRTGVKVPLIGFGTAPLGKKTVSREQALACLNRAIDLGITYLDTSPDYGSETVVGEVMGARRGEVFLATKVNNRSRKVVAEELDGSLERLQTDHVDLIQVHAVNAWADLEQALAPDGAVRALEEARQSGKVRFIGITGHARPEILAEGLRRYTFDTVLVALGVADHLVSCPDVFLLPHAEKRNAGVIAMKVFGHGCIDDRERALRYSLGLPGVSLAIIGMATEAQIEEVAQMAADYRPLDESEESRLMESVRPLVERDAEESQKGHSQLFWLHDTSVTGWKQHDEPRLVAY
jgi:aryl-alcohol dehydrogenase-like predicted oxidoreductase